MGQMGSSHAGGELELGHTQVVFPAVQDDARLEEARQGVRASGGHVNFGGHVRT